MNNNSRKKYLIKNTAIFSLSNFGTKLINFLLVPLYTYVLTTSEYGTIDLITAIVTVLVPLITLNISESILRFSIDKNADKEKILSIGIYILIFDIILILLCASILLISKSIPNYTLLVLLYVLTFASSSIFLCYLRGIEKLMDYSIINIIQALLIALLNILFLVKFKLGIKGYLISTIISYFVVTILCIIRMKVKLKSKWFIIDKKLFKEMVKYSSLLIPNSLMWWIINSLDKFMVSKMIGLHANGIYSVSYKIPSILITLTTIFNQAWMYSAIKEKDSKDKNEYTNNVFSALLTCVVITACILLIFIKFIVKIYVSKDFYQSWYYVSPLLVGSAFLTLGTFLANEYTVHKNSKGFLISSTLGAVVNLILNLILINIIGVLGAAIATCICYVCVFAYRAYDTKKYVQLNYFSFDKVLNLLCLISISVLIYFDNWFIKIIELIILIILMLTNIKFIKKVLKNIIYIVKNLIKRRKENEKK